MIGKVLQNNNFKETTRYVLVKEKARLLGSAVLESEADAIAQEFRLSRDLQPEIERPVYHLIASYSYEDAATKNLSDAFQLERAIEHFAGLVVSARTPALLRQDDKTAYKQQVNDFIETELYEYQWFCATHEDTKHKHTHFVASRINIIDGRCIPTWQDKERSQRICREMEREYGLQPLQSFYELKRRSPTRKQRDQWEATGIPPVMVMIQDAIDQEATPGRSIEQVLTALQEQHGVDTKISLDHGTQGIVFEQTDSKGETVRMSGSQLGRGYTYAAIKQRLEPERESELALTTPAVATKLEQTLAADETTQLPDPLELLQGIQPAIEPTLILESETPTVAVELALEKTEPNDEEMDQRRLQKLPFLVAEIWQYYQERYPKGFKLSGYRFAADKDNGTPTLWKNGTKRLEWLPTEKRYQVDGLTLADYEAIQRQAQKIRNKSIETVAPLMAKFLEQKGVKRWEATDSTYGLSREGDLLTYYKQKERKIVYQAEIKQGKWTAIAGRVPPEIAQGWLERQSQEKTPVKPPLKGDNGR